MFSNELLKQVINNKQKRAENRKTAIFIDQAIRDLTQNKIRLTAQLRNLINKLRNTASAISEPSTTEDATSPTSSGQRASAPSNTIEAPTRQPELEWPVVFTFPTERVSFSLKDVLKDPDCELNESELREMTGVLHDKIVQFQRYVQRCSCN